MALAVAPKAQLMLPTMEAIGLRQRRSIVLDRPAQGSGHGLGANPAPRKTLNPTPPRLSAPGSLPWVDAMRFRIIRAGPGSHAAAPGSL